MNYSNLKQYLLAISKVVNHRDNLLVVLFYIIIADHNSAQIQKNPSHLCPKLQKTPCRVAATRLVISVFGARDGGVILLIVRNYFGFWCGISGCFVEISEQ